MQKHENDNMENVINEFFNIRFGINSTTPLTPENAKKRSMALRQIFNLLQRKNEV